MAPWSIALLIAGGACLIAFFAWLFLIAPRARKEAMRPFCRPFTHRGLYGGDVPENSLAAFRRAAEAGFAIELDVQLSCDGEVFVFHDYTLTRMCARGEKLSDLPAAALSRILLGESGEKIPTLREVLDVVAGRVPILIELKGESADTALCPRVAEVLSSYRGAWCVESFNPLLLRWFRKHRKEVVRGLLVTNLPKEKKEGSKLLNFALTAQLLNFLARPAFLAWDRRYPKSLARKAATALCGAASLVYTVRDEAEYHTFLAQNTYPIFEHFLPR